MRKKTQRSVAAAGGVWGGGVLTDSGEKLVDPAQQARRLVRAYLDS